MLTEQRRKYAEARAKGYTKREAAIAAGCPPKTATQAAARLEKNPHVIAAIEAINGGRPLELPAQAPKKSQPVVSELPTSIDRPPQQVEEDPLPKTQDPVEFLRAVMNCERVPINERNKAAIKLADLEAKNKKTEDKPKTNRFRAAAGLRAVK